MTKVTAALLKKDDTILIAKRKAGKKLAGLWEFPGGKIEEAETPEACLKREFNEEFNFDVEIGSFFTESIHEYEFGTIQLLAYWAHWISGELVLNDHDEYRWVAINELNQFNFAPADIPIVEKLRREVNVF